MSTSKSNTRLNHLALFKISGDDVQSFLQGQLSNDINQLIPASRDTSGTWQFSAYCNPKGRTISLLVLWRTAAAIYAITDTSVSDAMVKRLRMYVMRSDVVIEPLNASLYGFASIESLSNIEPSLSKGLVAERFSISHDGRWMALGVNNRALLIGLNPDIEPGHLGKTITSEQWRHHQINEGLPSVNTHSSELFIPQMLNLDVLGGINFKKGCYTGQEIVARMHYLGKLKQRMFVCKVSGEPLELRSGDKVYADPALSKKVGEVVDYVKGEENVLAVLRLDALQNTIYVNQQCTITALEQQPYELPEPSAN